MCFIVVWQSKIQTVIFYLKGNDNIVIIQNGNENIFSLKTSSETKSNESEEEKKRHNLMSN